MFSDVPGVDIRIFTTELNLTEGFDLFASANGSALFALGTFTPPNVADFNRGTVDVDLNGTFLPAGAQYLRLVGTTVPISSVSLGFDFDAIGVTTTSAVPEPATLALLASGLAVFARRSASPFPAPARVRPAGNP